MPDIRDTPAEEEQSALEELSAISESTSVLTTNEPHGSDKLSTGVGDTEDDIPFVDNADMIDIREIDESPTALRPEDTKEILISVQIEVNEIQDTGEMETIPETALEVEVVNGTLIPNPVHKIQEHDEMERGVNTENQTIMFQDMMTCVKMDAGIHWDDTVDNAITARDKTIVVEKEGTEMPNSPGEIETEAANVTESTVPDPFAPIDDLINPEEGLVAVEKTIDTTTVSITNLHGNGEAEGIDGPGGLIGVGSSVESSGFTITEIADSRVIVEVFQAEQQQALWGFSDPLITPPEEEIIEAIGDLRTTLDDDIVDGEELAQSTEGLVLAVTTADDPEGDLQTYVDTLAGSSETIGRQNNQEPLEGSVYDDVEQPEANSKDTVMEIVPSAETGDDAEPLDLQDAQSLLPTATEIEMGDAVGSSVSPLVSTLASSPENMQLTDVGVEIAAHNATQRQKDSISGISVTEKEEDRSMPSEASSEGRNLELVVEGDSVPTFESGPVSISMTSYNADKLSSIDDSAVDIVVQQETGVEDNSNAAEGGNVNVRVASSTNGLGLDLEAALDSSAALMSETKPMVSAEAACVGPTVELEIYAQSNDIGIESALDVSTDILNGLPVGEGLDRNEKKRGREEEVAVAVAEDDKENTKTAKTSRDEISGGDDGMKIDAKIGEVVQVDKKRSRDDLESGAAEPDSCIQTKALKTRIIDDVDGPPSRKADTEEEADDGEECVDTEDKEEDVHVKIVNGAGLDSTAPRYKKRKIALMLGYSGAGYQGMQKNPGAITIEGELEEALFRAGAIAESNYGQPQKLGWRRAARTDKGVSAVGQVVSGCFFIDPPGFIERVNSHLPKQIRVYGYKRATAGFNAKKLCDRRKYEYVLPVYAFDPSVHLDRESAQALAAAEKVQSVSETEIKTTISKISGPAGEVDAPVTIDSEVKEGVIAVENGAVTGAGPGLKIVEPLVETIVSSMTEATDNVSPKIEGKEDSKIFSNRMGASTEEATVVTEVTQENVAAGVRVQTQEVLVETKEVTLTESVIYLSPEERGALDEKASTASVEVLVETKEVLTERKEESGTVLDLSIEDKKEALDEKVKKSTYKFGEVEFNRLNRILAGFEGHHNFHNFTVRTKATDPSANRYIISFGVENTFTMDGIEFVRCSVVGHSFMLHQIRKMIGLAVAIMRGKAPESVLATALRRDTRINVPMAPELGLFLEECYYTAYNRRFHATHEEMSLNSYAAEVDEFKKEFIYPHIVSTEARDSTFAMWLHSLNDRHYPDFVTAREAEKLIESQDIVPS